MPNRVRSQSCSEAWGSLGALESSDCRVVTGRGEVGIKSACPGRVILAAGGDVGSSGRGAAAGGWDGRKGRDGSDVGGYEV